MIRRIVIAAFLALGLAAPALATPPATTRATSGLYTTACPLGTTLGGSPNSGPTTCVTPPQLNRLFLTRSDSTPYGEVLPFESLAAVQAWYGTSSAEATLATDYFANYSGVQAQMLFARFPSAGARARLYGGALPSLATLQTITAGSLSVAVDGGTLSTSTLNLSGAASYAAAATAIQTALNASPPTLGTWTNSTIAPVTASVTGYFTSAYFYVTAVSSGTIYGGMQLTDGTGAIAAAVSGNAEGLLLNNQLLPLQGGESLGGVGRYGVNLPVGYIASETVTGTAGLLTVGSGGSGQLAEGLFITCSGCTANDAIQRNVSGSGVGSTWIVGQGDTISSETVTVVPAPIVVNYTSVSGAVAPSISASNFWFVPSAYYDPTSNGSFMSYASGSAAATLGLTQATAATLVPIGTGTPVQYVFMNDLVANLTTDWATAQSTVDLDISASSGETTQANAFRTWTSNNSGGQYEYISYLNAATTPLGQLPTAAYAANAATTGSANAYTIATTFPLGYSLSRSGIICAVANFTNTGATTLSINTTPAEPIEIRTPLGLAPTVGGEIVANDAFCVFYDSNGIFELMTPIPGGLPGTEYAIGQARIPFVLPSSGSMGNNGALSSITALLTTYPNAYVYLPAGAISSGSLAGWYYAVFSSTTAATIYNNKYTSGTPTIPASPTAFATTGPGAYTQTTGSFITAYSLTVPGNTIGANGAIEISASATTASSANAKTVDFFYGAYTIGGNGNSTSGDVSMGLSGGFGNRGVTNVQFPLTSSVMGTALSATSPNYGAVDSTSNQTLTAGLKLANASDYAVLESLIVKVVPAVP